MTSVEIGCSRRLTAGLPLDRAAQRVGGCTRSSGDLDPILRLVPVLTVGPAGNILFQLVVRRRRHRWASPRIGGPPTSGLLPVASR